MWHMDLIEKVFGVSPDGNSGALEVLLFAVPIVVLVLLYSLRLLRNKR